MKKLCMTLCLSLFSMAAYCATITTKVTPPLFFSILIPCPTHPSWGFHDKTCLVFVAKQANGDTALYAREFHKTKLHPLSITKGDLVVVAGKLTNPKEDNLSLVTSLDQLNSFDRTVIEALTNRVTTYSTVSTFCVIS